MNNRIESQTPSAPTMRDRATGLALDLAAVSAYAFEASPANEAARVAAATDVLQKTSNEWAVGGTVAALTFGIEFVSSSLISTGLSSREGLLHKLTDRFRNSLPDKHQKEDNPSRIGRILSDTGVSLGMGAGVLVLTRHISDDERTLKKDMLTATMSSILISGVSGSVGYLAAGGAQHAEGTVFEPVVDTVIDYAQDFKTWALVLGVYYAGRFTRNRVKKIITAKNSRREENNPSKLHEENYDNESSL